ncbi:MAG TPA: ATP-binding protein [Thermoanaerobaculia bacterium]
MNPADAANPSPPPLTPARYLGISLVYGVAFLGLFYLGSYFALAPGGSLWYPAAGLRLAAFLVLGWRLAPGVAAAEIAAVALYGLLRPQTRYDDWLEILQVATSPVIYALAAYALKRWVALDVRLCRPRDAAWLAAAALVVPLTTAATSRWIQLLLGHLDAADFIPSTVAFMIGDTIGVLMLTPLLLVAYQSRTAGRSPIDERPGSGWKTLLVDFTIIWASMLLLHNLPDWFDELASHVHWYLAFLPIIWISFRHGLAGSIAGILAITTGAAWLRYVAVDSIPFHELQVLVMFLAITSLLMGSVVSLHDAAERKLREQNRELRQAQSDLADKNRELGDKNAELERFVYTVSHDLKSPLITIRGFLGLMKQDLAAGNGERVGRDLGQIDAAAATMARLLDDLLELSRIGRMAQTPQQVDLAAVAREAVAQVAGRIRERGVDVETAPEMPVVTGDPPRLLQVFQNLVDNAVKFMGDQPRPRVTIGCERQGEKPVVFVRDNGVGIDARYHEKIFGLFNRLDATGEGTGIGLALVKRIVEEHGGRIWVESAGAGLGSTFRFTLGRAGEPPGAA